MQKCTKEVEGIFIITDIAEKHINIEGRRKEILVDSRVKN